MYEGAVQNLIDELGRLPGVGPKSAQRIAFHILNADAADMARLANAISTVKTSVSFCEECGNVSETKLCTICRDERRDPSVLCVVEESKDVVAIERTRSFTGRYHVLGGAINPLAGVGPEQLRIRELVSRLADERIQEIILAMDPNLEGEATATYLSRMLVPLGVRLSRLASGLPVGGDLEYADEITLGRALASGRLMRIFRSSRPGRITAASMRSSRLVAPMTMTFGSDSTPSISASSCGTMVVSISEERPEPRIRNSDSISSKNTTTGCPASAFSRAATKISRI